MKKVLITGGASGIGKCLVNGFHEKGYEVFTFDRVEQMYTHEHVHAYLVDLQDERAIEAGFHHIQEQFGTVDILINNAAIAQFHKPIQTITIEELDQVMDTNLRAVFLCSKYFVMQKETFSYGRIINIASTRFHQNEQDWEAYGMTKGGIVSLTNSLCVSLSNTNITVNAITPGWIEVNDYAGLSMQDHHQHPCGRVGKPKDILNVCLFLCEEENDFIDGANIFVDGGMSKRMFYV